MPDRQLVQDHVVTFVDEVGTSYPVALPRDGHTDREVRTVAFRWACKCVAEGDWRPHGELVFLSLKRVL